MRTDPAVPGGVERPLSILVAPLQDIAREAVLLLPLFLGLLIGLSHPVQNLNEGLYARIPEEMLASGNWVIPTLNGVPYLEKPPLMYWLTATVYTVFGVHEWTARVAPVLGIALGVAAIWRFARSVFAWDTALYAAWIYVTMPLAIVLGRTLLFDSLFTGLVAWSLVLLHEHWRSPQPDRRLHWSYAFLALAVLTKGLAALVICAGVAAAYAWSSGRQAAGRRLRELFEPSAVAVFFVIAVPWHIAAALQEPGFAWFYFVNEHVYRLLGTRLPHDYHTGPWWYHLPRVALYAFPWTALALMPSRHEPQERARTRDARRFLWLWFLVPLAVFSLAGEKGEYYMMIGMPALALLLAQRAANLGCLALTIVPLGWLGLLLWGRLLAHDIAPYRLPELETPILFGASVMITLSIAAFVQGLHRAGIVAAGVAGFAAMALFSGFIAANESLKSARTIAAEIARHPKAAVYLYQDYENLSALPFYLHANVGVVDSHSSDLWYGIALHPDDERFPDVETFAALAARDDVWLVVDEKRMPMFKQGPLAPLFATILRSGSQVLLRSAPGTD